MKIFNASQFWLISGTCNRHFRWRFIYIYDWLVYYVTMVTKVICVLSCCGYANALEAFHFAHIPYLVTFVLSGLLSLSVFYSVFSISLSLSFLCPSVVSRCTIHFFFPSLCA
jgi:hypothetical protein